ncbi:MAG: hypothetical protein HWQ38_09335 [Nostoc sp. NMS7]|uniref:hypothetical protein n=1 Tax=Nostoc sp. NMS7 TaxID=2815391 RepID=UPI0025F66A1F|nr:hypothetical protein [Nostoc sp. NMS7]MBN3946675.1 hypothetical protein [Nostoc sp. NMS7]
MEASYVERLVEKGIAQNISKTELKGEIVRQRFLSMNFVGNFKRSLIADFGRSDFGDWELEPSLTQEQATPRAMP